ncbi:dTDP-4-dehydrorhamnose 3,5-epimerase [Dasania marina]|uniref:dTDP-4-dehydrorhamnose 3,5-epimerase n=1 Tax=Dasania marina TaxID=471499 RepID=UPI0030DD1208|tara:strand:- start:37362 stop:37934 length:573 start_codon:yes stop_codon:yes gene_type:complete
MKFTRTVIPEVFTIEPEVHGDRRGYFIEAFRHDKLEAFLGHKINFVQDNESKSSYGILRGLHYQMAPAAQSKLVRVIKGRVLDVAVDVRKGSETFGQYVSIELSEINKKQMFVPRGFAHGFVVLEDDTIFGYKVDSYYSPENDRGIIFDDPTLNIDWRVDKKNISLSSKDTKQPLLSAADCFSITDALYS